MATVTDIWSLVEPYLAAERLELDDLELSGAGKGRFLRVVVDGDDLGVDRLADVSYGISRLLDEKSDLQDSYNLEVTSPGLERKLRRPEHFAKSVGREVKVKVGGPEGNRTYRGVLSQVTSEGFTVDSEEGRLVRDLWAILEATYAEWESGKREGEE